MVIGIIYSTPLKVGEWFGVLDLTMISLDEQKAILGLDFVKHAKETPSPHRNNLEFFYETRSCNLFMMIRKKLGMVPWMSIISLIEVSIESMDRPCIITQSRTG